MEFVHQTFINQTADETECAEFRKLAETLAQIIRAHGIESTPYETRDLPFFVQLEEDKRKEAIEKIAKYIALCQSVISDGGSLNSSPTFVWRAIREAGLIPPADLFSKILDTDIVEIYDLNNVQAFRNFKFFQFCSYTLEDLYCRPWHELFVRADSGVTSKIIELLSGMTERRDRRVTKTGIGTQVIEETASVRRYVMEADVKYLALLFDRNDRPSAFIGIEDARLLPRA